MVSAMDKGSEMLSLLIAQCHYVFLYRDLFPGHQSAPSAATEPSNQTNTAESMTGATSVHATGWRRMGPVAPTSAFARGLPPRRDRSAGQLPHSAAHLCNAPIAGRGTVAGYCGKPR